jgi:hypothetical protein
MILRHSLLAFALVFLSGGAMAQVPSPQWEALPPGVVLTRNFMVPESPAKDGFQFLPARYHLGSKAYAKALPDWWLEMVKAAGVEDKWHPKDFPLAFAGEFKPKDGSVALLVVQASQAYTGDGFLEPGPEIYLIARLFSRGNGSSKLLWEIPYDIGDMQYSQLWAGEVVGRQITFRTEGGSEFSSRTITEKRNWTLSLDDSNSVSMKKGEQIFIKK